MYGIFVPIFVFFSISQQGNQSIWDNEFLDDSLAKVLLSNDGWLQSRTASSCPNVCQKIGKCLECRRWPPLRRICTIEQVHLSAVSWYANFYDPLKLQFSFCVWVSFVGWLQTDPEKSTVPLDVVTVFGGVLFEESLRYGEFQKNVVVQGMQDFLNKSRMGKDHYDRDSIAHDVYYAVLICAEVEPQTISHALLAAEG